MNAAAAVAPSSPRDEYAPSLTLAQARDAYFRQNGFGDDGGYSAKWVDFKLGPLPFPFPNTPARVRAVKYHDLHHILTGYQTNFVGELEISAFEIGGGCADMVAAWVLNLAGLAGGMFIAPLRTARAFVRGSRAATLYRRTFDDALLGTTVQQIRDDLGVDRDTSPVTAWEILQLAAWFFTGAVVGTVAFAAMLALVPVGLVVTNLARRRAGA